VHIGVRVRTSANWVYSAVGMRTEGGVMSTESGVEMTMSTKSQLGSKACLESSDSVGLGQSG